MRNLIFLLLLLCTHQAYGKEHDPEVKEKMKKNINLQMTGVQDALQRRAFDENDEETRAEIVEALKTIDDYRAVINQIIEEEDYDPKKSVMLDFVQSQDNAPDTSTAFQKIIYDNEVFSVRCLPLHELPCRKRPLLIKTNKEQKAFLNAAINPAKPLNILAEIEKASPGYTSFKSAVITARFLTSSNGPIFMDWVKSGAIKTLSMALKEENDPRLQYDAAWALVNIAAEEGTNSWNIVNSEALKLLIKSIKSDDIDFAHVSVMALANLMGEDRNITHVCHNAGVPSALIEATEAVLAKKDPKAVKFLQEASRALFHMIFYSPEVYFEEDLTDVVEVLQKLMKFNDSEVIANAVWTFYAYQRRTLQRRFDDMVIETIPLVVESLKHPDLGVTFASIYSLSIAAEQEETLSQINIKATLQALKARYDPKNEELVLFILRLIETFASTEKQSYLQNIFDANILEIIRDHIDAKKWDVKKLALVIMRNLVDTRNLQNYQKIIETPKLIEKLTKSLKSSNIKVHVSAMETLWPIIGQAGKNQKPTIDIMVKNDAETPLKAIAKTHGETLIGVLAEAMLKLIRLSQESDDNYVSLKPSDPLVKKLMKLNHI